ncbi:TetR/AcrR family transcriptional regulator [Curvibacter gracilis]|uniref:TetR/AcrR family transcriptional regulator n=1 Tax=Curvibacter gracilis TaxID=230310 RepID=UPI0004893609|nr:TetR/AcrR family transcriptional regulator [Curvibacter gracilis]
MNTTTPARVSFKAQMHQVREEAIVQTVIRLLGEKGYDAMTVDEVAAAVGIAKASLYKHFPGKEQLAAAAMVHVIKRAQDFLQIVPPEISPVDKLKSVVGWAMSLQLADEMPSLPSRNSTLRQVLMGNAEYMNGLITLSDQLGAWITEAQAQSLINPTLPPLVVLYTLYARACDPVVSFLRQGSQYSNAQIVDLVLRTCFEGLATPPEIRTA